MTPDNTKPEDAVEVLLPCQRCKGVGVLRMSRDGDAEWVECRDCGHETPPRLSVIAAINDWNTRLATSPTPAPVAMQEGEVERVALFFFSMGYGACYADAIIATGDYPFPFDGDLSERWQRAQEEYEDRAELDAAITALRASSPVGEGWKLVPVEPTEGMCEASRETWMGGGRMVEMAAKIYAAMLAAAPVPPAGQREGE